MLRARFKAACYFLLGVVSSSTFQAIPENNAMGQETAESRFQSRSDKESDFSWHTLLTVDGLLPIQVNAITNDYLGMHPVASTAIVLTRGAAVVNSGRTGPNGISQFNGVRDGRHSVIAVGKSGIGVTGIYVAGKTDSRRQESLTSAEITLVPVGEAVLIRDIVARRERSREQNAGQILHGFKHESSSGVGSPQYTQSSDGSFSGRFVSTERLAVRAISGLKVTFIRNGRVLAETATGELGHFFVPPGRVSPGQVTVVATGSSGIAIFGASVVPATLASDLGQDIDGTTPVAFQAEGGLETNVSVADPQSAPLVEAALNDFVQSLDRGPSATGAAAAAGQSGGGGGGGSGGGGGGILGAVGLGLGAAALGVALDENKSPASPATP